MIYGRPVIQELTSLDLFIERLVPRTVQPPANKDWRAKKLKEFIDQDQDRVRWRLGDACKELGLPISDRQARRLFKDSTGISIREYDRKRRLVLAAKRLQDTDEPIKVVATDAGYRTHQAFKNSFYGMFGLTPMEFRKMWHRSQVTA